MLHLTHPWYLIAKKHTPHKIKMQKIVVKIAVLSQHKIYFSITTYSVQQQMQN